MNAVESLGDLWLVIDRIVIALLLMFSCTIIHAVFMIAANHTVERRLTRFGPGRDQFARAVLIWLLTLWMFLAIVIEAWLWALVYLFKPDITVLPDPQTGV